MNATFAKFAEELSEHVSAKATSSAGMSQLLIEIFKADDQEPGKCIASGTLDLLTIDAAQDTIDTSFAAALGNAHHWFGDADLSDSRCFDHFEQDVFPRNGANNAEAAGESLHGTSDSLNLDLALPTLKAVAEKTQSRLSTWPTSGPLLPWVDRLSHFKQDVVKIAKKETEAIYTPGPPPSGILEKARSAVAEKSSLEGACRIPGPPVVDIEPLMTTLRNVRAEVDKPLPAATGDSIDTLALVESDPGSERQTGCHSH